MSSKNSSDDHSQPTLGINTQLVRGGYDPFDYHGFVNPPLVRASTVLFPNTEVHDSRGQKYTYGTRGTPTVNALAETVNQLEGAAGTILVPSGLAAVTIPFFAYLQPGDHLLIVDSVYEPVRHFADTELKRWGVETEYYAPGIGAGIETLLRPNTRLIHLEAPGSNTFEVQDVPAIVAVARQHGIITSIDNTWATPIFFRPLDFGVDISIQASTKYPAGHADVLMGTVSANAEHWPRLKATNGALGLCGTPEEAYQVLRGLRSMGIRLERHQASALAVAEWLEGQSGVARVLYPPLPSFPGHDLWKRDFKGAGGVFSFVLDVEDPAAQRRKANAFLDALSLFGIGYSWGGFPSLALRVNLSDRTIARAPEEGPVLRLQIGLEDVADLISDLEKGLAAARAT